MEFLHNTDEFKTYFNLNSGNVYFAFQPLSDNLVGFTVKRRYPDTLGYHPPDDACGNPRYVALVRIEYIYPKDTNSTGKVPLDIGVYLCPFEGTKISLSRQKDPKEPIDLEFPGYFFDHSAALFGDGDGRLLSGRELLDHVYQAHCDTAHFWHGLRFRLKLRLNNACITTLFFTIKAMRFVLEDILGRKLRDTGDTLIPQKVEFDFDRKTEGGKKYGQPSGVDKVDYLEIFNYKAPKRLVVTFSTLVLFGYSTLFFICNRNSIWYKYLRGIFTNTFISAAAGIFLLFVLDLLVPKVILWLLNIAIRAHRYLLFRKIKF